MPGYDYMKSGTGADEMIFTVSSRADAETVQPNGTNLHSYASKVKPWIGSPDRAVTNTGKDVNGSIYAGNYDSDSGAALTTSTGAYWNQSNNVLKEWISKGSLKANKLKGSWFIEVTRPGRVFDLVNDSNTLARRPEGATNIGITEYTTAIKTPNIKIKRQTL